MVRILVCHGLFSCSLKTLRLLLFSSSNAVYPHNCFPFALRVWLCIFSVLPQRNTPRTAEAGCCYKLSLSILFRLINTSGFFYPVRDLPNTDGGELQVPDTCALWRRRDSAMEHTLRRLSFNSKHFSNSVASPPCALVIRMMTI